MSTTVKTGWLHNKNGDKFAPKTLISQVQTSDGISLEDKIQTDLDAVKNVQADWEQNDNTSGSYINNRPFGSMGTTEVALLDGTFEFGQNNQLYIYMQDSTTVFEIGKEYTVIFDGVNYTCTAFYINTTPALGNGAIAMTSLTDTGEPFIIGTNGVKLFVETKLTDASHTVTIKINEENIKKIDQKYIPDVYLSKDSPVGTGSFSLNRRIATDIGEYSFAEGYHTIASGNNSHAEGFLTTASGESSHAEGYETIASGNNSHAEGNNTTASGEFSHAEGTGTTAATQSQHVQGEYNIEDVDNTFAHIVGNGTWNVYSNAHTLDWSGNAWFQGDVYTGSTSGKNKDAGSKKLATEEYVDNSIDAVLPKTGGTMTGALTLAADPANDLEAATKQYVDTLNSSSQNTWYGTCTTAAATAAKVVTTTTGDFTLKEGATVYVLFNTAHTSTSRITLNVDGTGDTTVNLSSTNGMTAYQIAAKQVICFVYDGESFRVQGGSLATTQYYGLTKLSSSTSSTSTTMAATPSAVKSAYDLAAAAAPKSTLVSTTISNWTETVTYSNNAITATSPIELLPGTDISAEQLKALQAANIIGGAQSAGQIELKVMGTVPTIEIPVQFIIRGDL